MTATVLATGAPVVVAPAMDGDMWTHPATRANVARLRDDFGYTIVEPGVGRARVGPVGRRAARRAAGHRRRGRRGDRRRPVRAADRPAGRPLVEPPREPDLDGRHIVVSAGGTREAIDPVRFIGNRSTGGWASRSPRRRWPAARGSRSSRRTWRSSRRASATTLRVESTAELRAALHRLTHDDGGHAPGSTRWSWPRPSATSGPSTPPTTKLERGAGLTLELEPTPDILAQIARIARGTDRDGETTYEPMRPRPVLVGFAAETGSLDRAADKLRRKGVDLLVANDVAEPGSGFGTDTNRVTILDADGGRDELPLLSKREVADRVLDRVARALDDRDGAAQTGDLT